MNIIKSETKVDRLTGEIVPNTAMTTAAEGTEAKTIIEDAQIVEGPMATDKELIEALNIPFKPIDERILVKPLPAIKVTKTHDVLDEKKNKNKKPMDTLETKTVTEEVESNLRVGVVLSVGEPEFAKEGNTEQYKVGDKVVYVHKAAMPFDLLKDSVLIRRYEVLGLWLKDIEIKK